MDEIAVHVVVRGRVQGVGYRMWTVGEAWRHHVRGWVRNRSDGTVEALMIGRPPDVEALIAACHTGPRAARVTAVEREAASDDGSPKFYEKPTV